MSYLLEDKVNQLTRERDAAFAQNARDAVEITELKNSLRELGKTNDFHKRRIMELLHSYPEETG